MDPKCWPIRSKQMKFFNVRTSVRIYLVFLLACIMPFAAHAKRFTNEYIEFELPTGWECALEGSEWVCQSVNEERKKEAIIILVAKIRGEQDSLEQYMAYLKSAKTYSLPGGKTQVSEGKYAKMVELNEQRWVDSLHLASEVPGFYTRYLATVKEDLGVAVTFSVSKEHYNSYQGIFDKIVATIRVFRQKKVDLAQYKLKSKNEDLLDSNLIPDEEGGIAVGQQQQKRAPASSQGNMILFGLVGAAVVAGIVIMKKKK